MLFVHPNALAGHAAALPQVLATHNSYHIAPQPAVLELLASPLAQDVLSSADYLPQSWEYSHMTLTQQLEMGAPAAGSLLLCCAAIPAETRIPCGPTQACGGWSWTCMPTLRGGCTARPRGCVWRASAACWMCQRCRSRASRWAGAGSGASGGAAAASRCRHAELPCRICTQTGWMLFLCFERVGWGDGGCPRL